MGVVVALSISVSTKHSSADPIGLTGGQLTMGSSVGQLLLIGDRGFSLSATVGVLDAAFGPWIQCNLQLVCMPGEPIDLGAVFVGSSLHGTTVTLDGQTFTDATLVSAPTGAAAQFAGSAVAPTPAIGPVSAIGPFTFEGLFFYPNAANTGVIRELLVGLGTATVSLRPPLGDHPTSAQRLEFVGATYEFAPVPEPATLWLTVAGIASFVGLRHRRRARTPRSSTSP